MRIAPPLVFLGLAAAAMAGAVASVVMGTHRTVPQVLASAFWLLALAVVRCGWRRSPSAG